MTSEHVLAADSFVATDRGVMLASDLAPGLAVTVLSPSGETSLGAVLAVEQSSSDHDLFALFSSVGDVNVPAAVAVATRVGPVAIHEYARQVQAGVAPPLELLSPVDLPSSVTAPGASRRAARREAIRMLSSPVVRLPTVLGREAELHRRIVTILEEAGVDYAIRSDNRWTAYAISSPSDDGTAPSELLGEQARAILALTAWEQAVGGLLSRTTVDDRSLRRRLLAGLVDDRASFTVKWLPGYRPAEARVALSSRALSHYAAVVSVRRLSGTVMRLRTECSGYLMASLALIRPVRR